MTDLELMKLLDENNYEPTIENLKLLKESLSCGEIILEYQNIYSKYQGTKNSVIISNIRKNPQIVGDDDNMKKLEKKADKIARDKTTKTLVKKSLKEAKEPDNKNIFNKEYTGQVALTLKRKSSKRGSQLKPKTNKCLSEASSGLKHAADSVNSGHATRTSITDTENGEKKTEVEFHPALKNHMVGKWEAAKKAVEAKGGTAEDIKNAKDNVSENFKKKTLKMKEKRNSDGYGFRDTSPNTTEMHLHGEKDLSWSYNNDTVNNMKKKKK